jgi:hypothetical protein
MDETAFEAVDTGGLKSSSPADRADYGLVQKPV